VPIVSSAIVLSPIVEYVDSDTPPAAILVTHLHIDHCGCAAELARRWKVPVYVHPGELAAAWAEYLSRYGNPLDRWLIEPILRLLPAPRRARVLAGVPAGDLAGVLYRRDPDGAVPGLPEWEMLPSPGHTPGHLAFHRPRDRVVIHR
jgi:glyoxylase-like metal-dependent hydrolase (beta-lactamase superfamily II)